jgi:hypothetical protein
MGIKHQNVVQFVGYCAESKWEAIEQPSGSGRHILAEIQKRLLCFEYVSNKSLDRHIAGTVNEQTTHYLFLSMCHFLRHFVRTIFMLATRLRVTGLYIGTIKTT